MEQEADLPGAEVGTPIWSDINIIHLSLETLCPKEHARLLRMTAHVGTAHWLKIMKKR